jgi:hypothetical protein
MPRSNVLDGYCEPYLSWETLMKTLWALVGCTLIQFPVYAQCYRETADCTALLVKDTEVRYLDASVQYMWLNEITENTYNDARQQIQVSYLEEIRELIRSKTTGAEASWREFEGNRSEFFSRKQLHFDSARSEAFIRSYSTDAAREAFVECMRVVAGGRHGLTVWFSEPSDSSAVSFVQYRGSPGGAATVNIEAYDGNKRVLTKEIRMYHDATNGMLLPRTSKSELRILATTSTDTATALLLPYRPSVRPRIVLDRCNIAPRGTVVFSGRVFREEHNGAIIPYLRRFISPGHAQNEAWDSDLKVSAGSNPIEFSFHLGDLGSGGLGNGVFSVVVPLGNEEVIVPLEACQTAAK